MFTGIVLTTGTVTAITPTGGDVKLTIGRAAGIDWAGVALGDSIATNGVCLTATALHADGFSCDASAETLRLTTLGEWRLGQQVNLELAMTPTSRLGGHLVSGHVDGVGVVRARERRARSEWFRLEAPAELARYIAQKGSITVDGISLTVNAVAGNEFELNIVPYTLEHTTMGDYRPGQRVNLEVDQIARYLERLLQAGSPAAGITEEFLQRHGFGTD